MILSRFFVNLFLILVLGLLLAVPFTLFSFERVEVDPAKERILSATVDKLGGYVTFVETGKVKAYEGVNVRTFANQSVEYNNIYAVTNNTNIARYYNIEIVKTTHPDVEMFFTNTGTNGTFLSPNEAAYVNLKVGAGDFGEQVSVKFIVVEDSF